MTHCTYTVPDKEASGDNHYGADICRQDMIDYFWYNYGFSGNHHYWDDGFGFHDCCNTSKPLGRTFAALWCLNYSADDYMNESWNSPILNWGCRYTRNELDDLRSRCGDGSAIATSFRSSNDRVELYLGFWYTEPVVERAATLLHEARHQGGKGHNADFPAGSVFGGGDPGADTTWGYEGAWMYDALWLWWFYAEGVRTTSAIKERARQRGNLIIDNAFETHPGYSI